MRVPGVYGRKLPRCPPGKCSSVRIHGIPPQAAERIAEGVQIHEKGMLTYDALQRTNQRRDEQSHDSSVEFVRKPGAVSLAEIEAKVRMGHWVAKPGKELAAVRQDVAVVQGDHVGFSTG